LARTDLIDRPLAFIDTETTGLDARRHEIIEVAIIKEFPDGRLEEWSTKVAPQHLEVAEEIALRINGYQDHPELWEGAPTFDEIAATVAARLDDCILVGHNVSFDLDFLNEALRKAKSGAKLPYHKIDTVTLAFEHLVPQGLKSLSLDRIREFYGWPKDGAHTALVDARDCRRLYRTALGLA
jgi:DNA polymerase-3 subunit epsilon